MQSREGRDPQVTGEHGRDVVAWLNEFRAKFANQNQSAFDRSRNDRF